MTHPPRGTCVKGCPSYGLCHCPCGKPTQRAPQSRSAPSYWVKGEPYVWAKTTHSPAWQESMKHRKPTGGMWRTNGVPIATVRKALRGLGQRYTFKEIHQQLGIPKGTLSNLFYSSRVKKVGPPLARRVIELYLLHRPHWTSIDSPVSQAHVPTLMEKARHKEQIKAIFSLDMAQRTRQRMGVYEKQAV